MSWQYNGIAPSHTIYSWCLDNLKGSWSWDYETIKFDDKKDYAWFLLRWS